MEGICKNLGTFCYRTGDWSLFKERLDQALILNDDKLLSPERKRAFLLSCLTEETFSLLCDLCFPKKVSVCSFEDLCKLFDSHCKPVKNIFESRELFYKCKQFSSESVKDYAARLRGLSLSCNFELRLEPCLKDIFVIGIFNEKLKHKLFVEAINTSFSDCINLAATWEHVVAFKKVNANLNVVHKDSNYVRKSRSDSPSRIKRSVRSKTPVNVTLKKCFLCGKTNHLQKDCWKNIICNRCSKSGHPSNLCKYNKNYVGTNNKRLNSVFMVNNITGPEPTYVDLLIDNIVLAALVDTGAAINAMPYQVYLKYFVSYDLEKYNVHLSGYDGTQLNVLGKVNLDVLFLGKSANTQFVIIKNGNSTIVGRDFLQVFGIGLSGINSVKFSEINCDNHIVFRDSLKKKYAHVFSETSGRLKNYEANIEVNSDFRPKFVKPRPLPFSLREKVEIELQRMLQEDIIEKVEISDMASPIVVVTKKDGSIRICTDFKTTLNPMLAKLKYPLPRIGDLISSLNGAKYFAKIDLRNAFGQISLNEKSRKLCVISTHIGLFAYKVLPFGLSTSPAIFMQVIAAIVGGLRNVRVFLDDLLLFGNSKEELFSICEAVFSKLNDCGLTINENKCSFLETEIDYLGYRISQKGIMPLENKIYAITQMRVPKNVSELRSLLGVISYYRSFIHNVSNVLSPLYQLLKKGIKFVWSQECNIAFEQVKKLLTSDNILVHFDPQLPIKLITDASNIAISSVLCHVYENGIERPIAFASRLLSETELKYSILDKEACAIIFGLKKFFQYLYGNKFILACDNKSLVHILSTDKQIPVLAANRLQRYALILQTFDYSIEYVKSGDNKADFLSRLSVNSNNNNVSDCFEDGSVYFFNYIKSLNVDKIESDFLNVIEAETTMTTETMKQFSIKDVNIASIIELVINGWPDKKFLKDDLLKFWYFRNKLSTYDSCLFYNNKFVVPRELREIILNFIHQSHLGIVKSKSLARNYFFWLGMNSDIEATVKQCVRCMECLPTPCKVELQPWPISGLIWNRLHIDFMGPFGGYNFLIIVDATTKWIDCHIVNKVDSFCTIKVLKRLFSNFGIPEQIVSDNGTAFTSTVFKEFCHNYNIESLTSPVNHPASNGLAENGVKTVKNFLKKILINNKLPADFEDKLLTFLVDIRNTPSMSTGIEPSKLILGRKIRSIFNTIIPTLDSVESQGFKGIDNTIKDKMLLSQQKQKKYYRGKKFKKYFDVGSKVLTRDLRSDKNKWILGEIYKRLGNRIYLVKIMSTGQIWKRHHDQISERKVRWGESDRSDDLLDLGPLSDVDLTKYPNSSDFCRSPTPWEGRLRPRGQRPCYTK